MLSSIDHEKAFLFNMSVWSFGSISEANYLQDFWSYFILLLCGVSNSYLSIIIARQGKWKLFNPSPPRTPSSTPPSHLVTQHFTDYQETNNLFIFPINGQCDLYDLLSYHGYQLVFTQILSHKMYLHCFWIKNQSSEMLNTVEKMIYYYYYYYLNKAQ